MPVNVGNVSPERWPTDDLVDTLEAWAAEHPSAPITLGRAGELIAELGRRVRNQTETLETFVELDEISTGPRFVQLARPGGDDLLVNIADIEEVSSFINPDSTLCYVWLRMHPRPVVVRGTVQETARLIAEAS